MKKIALIFALTVLFCISVASADENPEYIGMWVCAFNVSEDSTTFVMFKLLEDHSVLYSSQFFYNDHPGMTEKGVWTWEEINEKFFRIHAGDDRLLYFEMKDSDHLDSGNNLIYTRYQED